MAAPFQRFKHIVDIAETGALESVLDIVQLIFYRTQIEAGPATAKDRFQLFLLHGVLAVVRAWKIYGRPDAFQQFIRRMNGKFLCRRCQTRGIDLDKAPSRN